MAIISSCLQFLLFCKGAFFACYFSSNSLVSTTTANCCLNVATGLGHPGLANKLNNILEHDVSNKLINPLVSLKARNL
jgi:hypothetical protein